MYYSCLHARCFVKFCFAMKQIRYLHVTYTLAQVTEILLSSMTGENFKQLFRIVIGQLAVIRHR